MANVNNRTGNTEINSFRLLRKMWFWLTPVRPARRGDAAS